MAGKTYKAFLSVFLFALLAGAAVWAEGSKESPAAAKEIPEIHIWPSLALSDPNGSNPDRIKAVQDFIVQKVGVKPIAYVPPAGAEATTKLNLILGSANQRMDIFVSNWNDYKAAIIPINDLLKTRGPNVVKAFSKEQWAGVTDSEGKIWGIPRLGTMGHTHWTWFNTKMFKDNSLNLPKTYEEMMASFEKIRAKNPNAIIHTRNLGELRLGWAGAFTKYGYSKWPDAQGNLQAPEFQDGYKDFVAAMADLYKKGYLFKESFVTHDAVEVLKTGNVAIFMGWYSVITIHFNRLMINGVLPGVDYAVVPKFGSKNGLVMTNNASPSAATMIAKKCPNPEAAMDLLNWQYDPGKDNVITATYGIQGVDWEWVDAKNKYYVHRLQTEPGKIYAGEFMVAVGLGTDTWYAPDNPDLKRHMEFIRDYALDYSNGKMPYDFDVPYDIVAAKQNVPSFDDINRMIDEETIKFITGVRPLGEWNQFVADLKKIGIDQLYKEYTRQYKMKTGK